MVKYILFFLVMLRSCYFDDKLLLKRTDNKSSLLNINGVFLEKSEFLTCVYFLYSNGTILYEGCVGSQNIEYRLQEISSNLHRNTDIKYLWGVYEIAKDSTIKFEKWYPSERPYYAYLRKGKIINDSTFFITESSDPNGKNKDYKHQIYILNKFHPKPDSTNRFIK